MTHSKYNPIINEHLGVPEDMLAGYGAATFAMQRAGQLTGMDAEAALEEGAAEARLVQQAHALGRNAKCPCGSGRKVKQCHGRQALPAMAAPPGRLKRGNGVVYGSVAGRYPCPCGSGASVAECRCPAVVPPGVRPVLLEKTNPADYIPVQHTLSLDDYIKQVVQANDGKPFPPEYNQVIQRYHSTNVTLPRDACRYIQCDIAGTQPRNPGVGMPITSIDYNIGRDGKGMGVITTPDGKVHDVFDVQFEPEQDHGRNTGPTRVQPQDG